MTAHDMRDKTDKELTRKELIDLMLHDRQIDIAFNQVLSDADGYLSWDAENWSCVDGRRFIRCYSLKGRVLRDSTTHNIYDMDNDFAPEKAATISIN